jgi:hypothetical protein
LDRKIAKPLCVAHADALPDETVQAPEAGEEPKDE